MKKRGRFTVEAAYIAPMICILFCTLFFFTLYSHDYAVGIMTVLEYEDKGLYEDGRSNEQIRADLMMGMQENFPRRLFWVTDQSLETSVGTARITVAFHGKGNFLPVEGVDIEKGCLRIHPAQMVRTSKWLGEISNGS